MQDQDKKAHAFTSFALFGLFGSPRDSGKTQRNVSRPQDFRPFERK